MRARYLLPPGGGTWTFWTWLVVAVGTPPLIIGWIIGVAMLDAHVVPFASLYGPLIILGVMGWLYLLLAVFLGVNRPLADGVVGIGLRVVALAIGVVTVFCALGAVRHWALDSLAGQRTCTVARTTLVQVANGPGFTTEKSYDLSCGDGERDILDPRYIGQLPDLDRGDRLTIAHDPTGYLRSLPVENMPTPVRDRIIVIGTGLAMLAHAMFVIVSTRRAKVRDRT